MSGVSSGPLGAIRIVIWARYRTLLTVSSGGNDQIVITDPAIDQFYGAMQKLAV
jgi:hypothetical protein